MSTKPESALTLWLPALKHIEPGHLLHQLLARADRLTDGSAGYPGGLVDYFQGACPDLPAAALTREFLAGDAGEALWLSADPAWVQPDMNGVRLLACGQLQLNMHDAHALAAAVMPAIHDAGMQLEISTPDRWHLKLPDDACLPAFAAPEQALGEDFAQHLPRGTEGRRWRVLLNDIQVLLHQHPLNAARRAQGLAPVNSLWFWGGGRLPGVLRSQLRGTIGDDLLLNAIASRAGVTRQSRSYETVAAASAGCLIDLQDLPVAHIASQWWPALKFQLDRQPAVMHFAGGERWLHKPWHRWRFWRGAGRFGHGAGR